MKIAADGISLSFDPELGILEQFTAGGIAPLHRAPWVGRETMPDGADPHLARLGGDFFCAPFGGNAGDFPTHGWPPNARWQAEATGAQITAVLQRDVQGARLTKTLALRSGHPFVYQSHSFEGGAGEIAVSNHANVSLPKGGLIRTSPKRHWETPAVALEPDAARGRSSLRYPAQGPAEAFPALGGTADLGRFPWAPDHEDFVSGLEASGHALGWTAVTRLGQGDLFLSLRSARTLPMTMLWHSHGGRDYAPWSGRHRHCLGVEEGAARHMLGLSDEAALAGPGAISLGAGAQIRHVIGAIPWPEGAPVTAIRVEGDHIVVEGPDGHACAVMFDAGFVLG